MRDVSSGMNAIEEAVAVINHSEHITKYERVWERLTGSHETCKMSEFMVFQIEVSIRIPMNTAKKAMDILKIEGLS